MEIGYKLKKIRELRNYSQEYLAEKIGISQVAYSKIESGRTKLGFDRLREIAGVLEVDPIMLLSFDESVVFNHCHQSGSHVYNYNGLTDDKIAAFETRISSLESHVLKILDQQHKKETGG
jgi:transcriptional regulator with XRE-family HTH domain